MALKAIMLRKKIDDAKKQLEALNKTGEELQKREAEIETAIEESETEEERAAVEAEIEDFEADKKAHAEEKETLEREIEELEGQLEATEKDQDTDPIPEERKKEGKRDMEVKDRIFEREDVKAYIAEFRDAIQNKRAITNAGLTVPTVLLGILRENVMEYSKLYKHVNVQRISGEGRQVIMGTVPEAVWTECCANLNEMDLTFNAAEVACWKVGGYYAVCNAILEDSDVDLTQTIMAALGQGIGLALDKAILYGTGTRMPLGVVSRLVQTTEPSDYPADARPWADLHTSNIASIPASATGIDLFRQLIIASGAAKGRYSRGEKVWAMNETTYTSLIANAANIDAAGSIVAGVNGTMPVIGGVIEVLDFIPNNVIVGGYFDLYLLAERAAERFASSEHVRFLADQTIMKGIARYDGLPVIAEGFVAIGIGGTTPNATMTFAPDTANTTQGGQ